MSQALGFMRAKRLWLKRWCVSGVRGQVTTTKSLATTSSSGVAGSASGGEALADLADADDAEGHAGDLVRAGAEQTGAVPRAAAQRVGDRKRVARKDQHRHRAVLGDRLRVAAGDIRHHDAARGRLGERHEVGAGAVDRNGAHARRCGEQTFRELASGDDAVGLARQAADGLGSAVRSPDELGVLRQAILAGWRNGIDDKDAVHQTEASF